MINKMVNGNEENVAIDKMQLAAALSPRDVKINTLLNTTPQKAEKSDLTSIIATGSTNTTGATITAGTYFYLNGTLVKALSDIASGATFTSGTNYQNATISSDLPRMVTRKYIDRTNAFFQIVRYGKIRLFFVRNVSIGEIINTTLDDADIPAHPHLNGYPDYKYVDSPCAISNDGVMCKIRILGKNIEGDYMPSYGSSWTAYSGSSSALCFFSFVYLSDTNA